MTNGSRQKNGFTLIEIMIAVAIMGIILTMGLPTFVRAVKKDGMRKATSDMVEACGNARATAILSGENAELIIRPKDGTLTVVKQASGFGVVQNAGSFGATSATASTVTPPAFSAQIPGNVGIELLGVNFIEYQDATEARVRFYPNGMSDEFTIILRSLEGEVRKISLESVTGLAEVMVVR